MKEVKEIVCPKCGKNSGQWKEKYEDMFGGLAYDVRCHKCSNIIIFAPIEN